jgi:hypothetical protein
VPATVPPYTPVTLSSSPWFPTATGAFSQLYSGTAVAQNGIAVFAVNVTTPQQEVPYSTYPFGSLLNLCLQRGTTWISECFSWDYPAHDVANRGLSVAQLSEVCDGADNDNNGQTDENLGPVCGHCGGQSRCNGTCTLPDPPGWDTDCNCGGKVQCSGACSQALPAGVGNACGCGGTVLCDLSCSNPGPSNLGQACGCSGTIQCDGSCSNPGPSNLGQGCGCSGAFQCDGSCSNPGPADLGQGCGCGGNVGCDGLCSAPLPAGYGTGCGQCGGVVTCGGCSVATPSDLGTTSVKEFTAVFGSGSHFTRNFEPDPGWVYESCRMFDIGGNTGFGLLHPSNEGSCAADFDSTGIFDEGGKFLIQLTQRRICDTCQPLERTIHYTEAFGAGANYTKTFNADDGWEYVGCTMTNRSGGGFGLLHPTDEGTCTADFHSTGLFGLEGARFVVHLTERQICP